MDELENKIIELEAQIKTLQGKCDMTQKTLDELVYFFMYVFRLPLGKYEGELTYIKDYPK